MLSIKRRAISSSRSTPANVTNTRYRKAITRFQDPYSMGSATTSSIGSMITPKTDSVISDGNTYDEQDYELTRQLMRNLIQEIQVKKLFISFNDMFLDEDNMIGCLLRIFNEHAEDNINGIKQITREQMLKLLENSNIIDNKYTVTTFINDWNNLRKQMIKKKLYERRSKTLDFCGFIQLIDLVKNRIYISKDEILKKIIGPQIYSDIIKLKEVQQKIELDLLPSVSTLISQYNDMQMKLNDRRLIRKKKKKKLNIKKNISSGVKSKKKRKKKVKTSIRRIKKLNKLNKNKTDGNKSIRSNILFSPQSNDKQQLRLSSKEFPKLKTVSILQPWIVHDELDNDLKNKLFELFELSSEQFEPGLIRKNVFIQWLRASHVISDTYSINIIEGVLLSVLAHNIDANNYQLISETFEWNGFLDCIRQIANEIHLSLNDFVKKLLIADEFSLQRWRAESEHVPLEATTGKQTSRPWDSKKVLVAVNIMRDVVEESRKLHLTDDERKRLRSLYKEFATFAYRRQSAHLEVRLTNSVLSSWMRECRIFDDKYTINELDKDFISILGDFTLNGVYPQGTRDIDFDGFLILIQTIAAHKHIRADDLVQMIFAGPRSPLQKTAEFNEHMDRTKIQTSQIN